MQLVMIHIKTKICSGIWCTR